MGGVIITLTRGMGEPTYRLSCLEYLLVQPGTQQLTGILERFANHALGTRVRDVTLK